MRALIYLAILLIFDLSQSQNPPPSTVALKETRYLVHKHQPTIAPCKYGVQRAFDQPHFLVAEKDKSGRFETKGKCCEKCEMIRTVLPGTNTYGILCCLPDTPYKHGLIATTFEKTKGKKALTKLVHPLAIVFDSIVPKSLSPAKFREQQGAKKPRTGTGAYGAAFLGAAAAQLIILVLTVVFWHLTKQRIQLETVADADYTIEEEVRVFNPSKSAIMSDNMNSDLMSMSQALA
ncbi:hypothetical protein CRE_13119 [Caenorhabditis remanei]|uniref:Uncharacterized protein n=1 Tax=Caenorhabditis remanei TaxID=31234 RepID=E3NIM7_CAERE|nr:hypothetical protein CRE_13119 [Caenorhabditis remanei]